MVAVSDSGDLSPWSMVAIRNYDDEKNNIFPPINHENLQLSSPDPPPTPHQIHTDIPLSEYSDSDSNSSSSTFSPPLSPLIFSSPPPPPPKVVVIVEKHQEETAASARTTSYHSSWIGILRCKLNIFFRFLFAPSPGVFSSFRSVSFAVVLFAFLYLRRRRRARVDGGGESRLIGIIKQKDEKINQLLDQVSRMNQMLLAFHKLPNPPSSS